MDDEVFLGRNHACPKSRRVFGTFWAKPPPGRRGRRGGTVSPSPPFRGEREGTHRISDGEVRWVKECSWLGRAGFDRRCRPAGPIPTTSRHRLRRRMAEQICREGDRAGGHPRAAARHHRPVERDPRRGEQPSQFLGAFQLLRPRIGDQVEGQVKAPRDMAAAPPRPGFLAVPSKRPRHGHRRPVPLVA